MSGQAPEPILPYFIGWAVLLLLLGLTVWSAYLDIGVWHPFVNFGIAFTQTAIIFILFMRLRAAPRITWLIAGAGFFRLMFLYGLTTVDYATRSGLSN
jgi:cytochrome c oxidase subunit IV